MIEKGIGLEKEFSDLSPALPGRYPVTFPYIWVLTIWSISARIEAPGTGSGASVPAFTLDQGVRIWLKALR
jgi:hypothetical protein